VDFVFLAVLLTVFLSLLSACHRNHNHAEETWKRALLASQRSELSAGYEEFLQVDPQSPQGILARARLVKAKQHYERAIELLATNQPGAKEELVAGKALAPLPPRMNLPLARLLREKNNFYLAAQFYRSYVRHFPREAETAVVQKELADVETELWALSEGEAEASKSIWSPELLALLGIGLLLFLSLLAVPFLYIRYRRDRSLEQWLEQFPELQPAILYLIGTLRHELLKHRIFATRQLLKELSFPNSPASASQTQFLKQRLYGGTPLQVLWKEHVHQFSRVLRTERSLPAQDPNFAQADAAISALVRLESQIEKPKPDTYRRLVEAEGVLREFDRNMARLLRNTQRTQIGLPLFSEATHAVRNEFRAAQVPLDELLIVPPTERIAVSAYRIDLLLVLKNLIRNALFAVEKTPAPRRIAIDVVSVLLETGEELVKLRVHDTCPGSIPLNPPDADGHTFARQRGLDLVRMTLRVYGGTLLQEEGLPGFSKCVVAQLFRIQDETDIPSASVPD
jgi:hypothetical protein